MQSLLNRWCTSDCCTTADLFPSMLCWARFLQFPCSFSVARSETSIGKISASSFLVTRAENGSGKIFAIPLQFFQWQEVRLVLASSETRGQSSNSIVWQPPFGRRERERGRDRAKDMHNQWHTEGHRYTGKYTQRRLSGAKHMQQPTATKLRCPVTVNGSHHRARLLITGTELSTGLGRQNLDSATRMWSKGSS